MLGSPCSPCCDQCPADGKPRTDPADEGTWVPSGAWPSVTWTFQPNTGSSAGKTWFFFGSISTSGSGSPTDWNNLCNWYSSKTNSPSATTSSLVLNKRASRLPPGDAIVHVFTNIDTATAGPQSVAVIYFWSDAILLSGSSITTTQQAHGTSYGSVLSSSAGIQGSTTTNLSATITNGAFFAQNAYTFGRVDGGAEFIGASRNAFFGANIFGVVNGGAIFRNTARNQGATVNGGAVFFNDSTNTSLATVNGGAVFNNNSANLDGFVYGGGTFNNSSYNIVQSSGGIVFGGITLNGSAINYGVANGGGTLNGNSINAGIINGTATLNDSACTTRARIIGNRRYWVTNDTTLPVCNGSAPNGTVSGVSCGCG